MSTRTTTRSPCRTTSRSDLEAKIFSTIVIPIGDVDALVRLSVDSVDDLQRVVNQLRRKGAGVVYTKTLIVIAAWSRNTLRHGAS